MVLVEVKVMNFAELEVARAKRSAKEKPHFQAPKKPGRKRKPLKPAADAQAGRLACLDRRFAALVPCDAVYVLRSFTSLSSSFLITSAVLSGIDIGKSCPTSSKWTISAFFDRPNCTLCT